MDIGFIEADQTQAMQTQLLVNNEKFRKQLGQQICPINANQLNNGKDRPPSMKIWTPQKLLAIWYLHS